MAENYHEDVKNQNIQKLRDKLKELPRFVGEYFRGIDNTKSSRTKLVYAGDIKIFFDFLINETLIFTGKSMKDLVVSDLDGVSISDIEEFAEYLSYYTKRAGNTEQEFTNEEHGKARKLAAVRTMFKYFYKKEQITKNPADFVESPKIHEKAITKLETDEVAKLLDAVESGEFLLKNEKARHANNCERDLAIITLLLGTGMRVSECVGINLEHLDFDRNAVKVTRKGGNESVLYFSREVSDALKNYIEKRKKLQPLAGHEHALFISQKRMRITCRAVENLLEKYTRNTITTKHITPHKLRSTFGTHLYRESGDIYLVADVLGHRDVNTTRKHYADVGESRRREAVKYVKLREN